MSDTKPSIRQIPSSQPGFTIIITTAVMLACACLNTHAQEEFEPAPQFRLPAQEVEIQNEDAEASAQDKEDADDPAGAVSPSNLPRDKAISPGDLREQQPGLQDSDRLPAVQKDKLPAVQQDKLPAVQQDRLPAVQQPQPISDDPETDAPFVDGGFLPDDAGKPGIDGPAGGSPGPELPSPSSEFGDALPEGAGTPDIGGPGDGGFVPEDLLDFDPEVAFGDLPKWTRFAESSRVGGFPGQLHYGSREEVRFTVVNYGERETSFRAAYQIEDQTPYTSDIMRLGPGEEKPVSMNVDLTSLSPAARERIKRDHELTIRIFVAHGNPIRKYNYNSLLYRDARVDNHKQVRDIMVRSDLEVSVEFDRLRQHALCEDWVQSRDWKFFITTPDGWFWHILDGKPAFWGDGTVQATTSLRPPISYTLALDWHDGELTTSPMLFAMKDNGDVKNSGRSALFEIRESIRNLAARGNMTGWVRSSDNGGRFCGSNLELRYNLHAELMPERD